jgi:hypothetical protein
MGLPRGALLDERAQRKAESGTERSYHSDRGPHTSTLGFQPGHHTVAEARALWWLVDRPNLFVKIPAVKQGLPAISACLAEGISINVTLIFSLARYA